VGFEYKMLQNVSFVLYLRLKLNTELAVSNINITYTGGRVGRAGQLQFLFTALCLFTNFTRLGKLAGLYHKILWGGGVF